MKNILCWIILAAIFVDKGLSIPAATEPTPNTEDDDDADWDDDDDSSEADDDGRVYKNPRNSPSTECPRDEEQATLLGQKCLRKCSSDEDCKSKKKKCLCDGACGMSCIKPDRECPELPKPELGTVTVSERHFAGRATYTCPHGYHVVGLQSRLCQADGKWAGTEPACKQNIYCLTPPLIEHARHSALPEQATFDLDSTVQYHCHTGYVTNGFPRAKCLAIEGQASWYGPDISCEPRSCGQPLDPGHGWHAGECYTFGCRVTYHCGEGYELVGKQERFCQADGAWTPKELPTCVLVTAVQCLTPENPKNGRAIYTSCSYNSVVSYECRYGFTLVGESSRRCGADRKWSGGIPVCKEINCGHPGILYNGWLENIESGTGLGASIIFRCHPGMLLIGNTSTVCQIDGRWRYQVPQCLAPCVVPTISQGLVVPIDIEVDSNATTTMSTTVVGPITKVQHGTQLNVICDDHYEFPLSALAPPTCNNGTWSVIPRCVPARCKSMPRSPKNGMVLAPKTEHGMKARFKCKDGFNLTGPGGKEVIDLNDYILTCSFGNWTGETPFCQEIYCSFPGYIENGKVLLVGNMGLYDYRPYVKKIVNNKQIMYDCDKGYVLNEGPPGATCVGGKWRPTELPKCIPGQHPRLRWNRRRRRSIRDKDLRNLYLLHRYRELLRKRIDTRQVIIDRTKRNVDIFYRGRRIGKRPTGFTYRMNPLNRYKRHVVNNNAHYQSHVSHALQQMLTRKRRELSEIEQAYSKYYEKIKEKYKTYVKTLLGVQQSRVPQPLTEHKMIQEDNLGNEEPIPHQDWYNSYNNQAYFGRNRYTKIKDGLTPYNSEIRNYYRDNADRVDDTAAAIIPIAIPNINEHYPSFRQSKKELTLDQILNDNNGKHLLRDGISTNEKPFYGIQQELENTYRKMDNGFPLLNEDQLKKSNLSIIAQLKSQLVRRKRSMRNDEGGGGGGRGGGGSSSGGGSKNNQKNNRRSNGNAGLNQTAPSEYHFEGGRRLKPKGPCEPIQPEPHLVVDIIRPSRNPSEQLGAGTIIKITCGKGFTLNLNNPNGTAKCVRGRWKPITPECIMLPCLVPTSEHGRYYSLSSDSLMESSKPSTTPMNTMEEVQNGHVIAFQCSDGYNVQGVANLRCWHGEWAVTTLPDCLPAPCILPPISDALYQGGYRAGLTIAHGSSVNVVCENPAVNGPMQMECMLGNLTPKTINCGVPASRKSREEYMSGFEVSLKLDSDGDSSSSEESSEERDCGPPSHVEGSLIYRNGEPMNESEHGYPSGTEITFNCISSAAGERTTWKIICEDGAWIGRSLNCANGSCLFRNNEPHVVSFYNDLEIREEVVEFPPGATIISRCVDIGKYAMIGSGVRSCIHSEWSGQKPACFGLNQENDYAMEKPPTVLFRHQSGPIAQSNDGKLIVYPGTTVHMECLWMRRFGNPKWNVSHDYRKYPEGWVTDDGRDPQLEYRLSIFHAVEDDSGLFTCQTPARHEHSVDVVVKAVNCPEIPARRGLTLATTDTKMSAKVVLSCANGNSLIGASELTCLPSGNWSAPLPVCESVECGDIPLLISLNGSAPRVAVLSREVGGRAAFSCPSGFGLRGPSESICMPSGEWGLPFPTCVEVQCENPGAPQNGYAQGSPPYRAGDVVQFNCNPEYMMQGQPIIACQDNGRWSGGLPKCVQACSYPGTAISGRMSSVKFYYAIGESITFTCDAGLDLRGAKMLKCLRNGKWSNAIPTCVNPDASSQPRDVFRRQVKEHI